MNEVLLRGCTLKNSVHIHGLVIYTGPETRIQQNSAAPPRKLGAYDGFLNVQIIIVLIMQLSVSPSSPERRILLVFSPNCPPSRHTQTAYFAAPRCGHAPAILILMQPLASWSLYKWSVAVARMDMRLGVAALSGLRNWQLRLAGEVREAALLPCTGEHSDTHYGLPCLPFVCHHFSNNF
jgi:hypothetical protein